MTTKRRSRLISAAKLALVALFVLGGFAIGLSKNDRKAAVMTAAHQETAVSLAPTPKTGWEVGELRDDGLRIIPSEPSDASRVLDPEQFTDPQVKRAYWIATQIPEVLNQLYCWCGCENTGVHRSNLACFEDLMGVDCDVCQGTAEIAYAMVQRGVTDAARIQAAVDVEWGPKS